MINLLEKYEKLERYYYIDRYVQGSMFDIYTNNNILSDYIKKYMTCRYKKYNLRIIQNTIASKFTVILDSPFVNTLTVDKTVEDIERLLKKEGWKFDTKRENFAISNVSITNVSITDVSVTGVSLFSSERTADALEVRTTIRNMLADNIPFTVVDDRRGF